MNQKVKGYLLAIIAASTYGMNPLFALPLYADGMNPDSVLFLRYLLALPVLALMLRLRGRSFSLARRDILPLILMGLLFAFSSLALFASYNYMDAGIASTMLFVYPIMVALIMSVCFKEKLTVQTIICIVMALAGIGLLYKGSDGATLSLVGTLMVIGSALAYAIYIVAVNQSRLSRVPTIKLTFYVLLFGWTLFAVRCMMNGELHLPSEGKWYLWLSVIALALLPTAVSLLCTTAAIQAIGSTPTAILGAMEPATAIFFGVTVFGETLTLRDTVGLILIVIAVSLVVVGGKLPTYLVHIRKMFPSLARKLRRK